MAGRPAKEFKINNMQTVSPKLTDKVVKELIDFAGTKNAGASEAIEAYVYIRRATLQEIKGRFSKAEATALMDMYNGTMLTPDYQYQPQAIRIQVEDAEKFESSCSRHGADIDKLLSKTDQLTAAQTWVLQQEIVRAWNENKVDEMIKFLSNG